MTARDLSALQLPDGSFESTVSWRGDRLRDCNGFTAAMVLRATRHVPDDAVMTIVRERALRFLTTCASSTVPGAFAFWPDAMRPAWARSVPADVDDTAIMLTELVRHGWLERHHALRRFCRAVIPQRVRASETVSVPPWIVPGSFYTWMADPNAGVGRGVNIVDCCVNANVVALMSRLKAEHLPGYEAAILTVANGVRWAGGERRRLLAVTPFYPAVTCLIEAVEHAVETGASALGETRDRLRSLEIDPLDVQAGCCRSAYGSTVWHCSAIDVARALAIAIPRSAATRVQEVQEAAR